MASRGGFAVAREPHLAMSCWTFSLSGVRDPKVTACPAPAQRVPRAAPTPPVPRIARFIVASYFPREVDGRPCRGSGVHRSLSAAVSSGGKRELHRQIDTRKEIFDGSQ